jgi:hypothetical protein
MRQCPLPIVLIFDEIDSMRGQSLISVLRQLRDGFRNRPHSFPASVVLCGLRDVRDYRAAAGRNPERLGMSSPFNIAVESLRISDFTRDQVAEPYGQHTADTGQEFTPEAVDRASFLLPDGQAQLDEYLSRLGLDSGTLVIFDRRPGAPALCANGRTRSSRVFAHPLAEISPC